MMFSKFDVAPDSEEKSIKFNPEYLQGIPGLLKLIEIILLLFTLSLAASFQSDIRAVSSGHITVFETEIITFHLLVTIPAWLGGILLFAMNLFNVVNVLKEKFSVIFLVLMLLHVVGALFLFICTVLVLNDCVQIRSLQFRVLSKRISVCTLISNISSTNCAVYEGAGAASVFASIALTFDAVLHVLKWLHVRRIQAAEKEAAQKDKADKTDEENTHDEEQEEQNIENPYAEE